MRVFDKICPACQTRFEAKRRNQIYCTSECRADINNDKLKAKFNRIKTLEKDNSIGNQYKAAYQLAIRVVQIEYDRKQKNDVITFEGRKFEKISLDIDTLKDMGIYLRERAVNDDKRTAIYIPHEGLLCFLRSYDVSANGVTFRLVTTQKK